MNEDNYTLEMFKIANDICKSHKVPYGHDEIKAEFVRLFNLGRSFMAKDPLPANLIFTKDTTLNPIAE